MSEKKKTKIQLPEFEIDTHENKIMMPFNQFMNWLDHVENLMDQNLVQLEALSSVLRHQRESQVLKKYFNVGGDNEKKREG